MKTKIRKFSKLGRGVVATQNFKKGQVVESSHVLVLDKLEHDQLTPTLVNLYVFGWKDKHCAIAFGNGSLFNHSDDHNVTYSNNYKSNKIVFKATRNIKKGEQLFINYGYDAAYHFDDYLRKKEQLKENAK